MQIVKKDSFRSQGSTINKTDDMYRVVVDMKRTEYPQFAKLVVGQKPSTNSVRDAICPHHDIVECIRQGKIEYRFHTCLCNGKQHP